VTQATSLDSLFKEFEDETYTGMSDEEELDRSGLDPEEYGVYELGESLAEVPTEETLKEELQDLGLLDNE